MLDIKVPTYAKYERNQDEDAKVNLRSYRKGKIRNEVIHDKVGVTHTKDKVRET